ncbi:MAG TPA: acetyl-CoA carboxylase biotin carboxylase subunit, partial [Blastocatellia bacterium]|nr:acetyl-CoA carboxylase biotin carboxylase subunit [Blastocatellia bacterium]
MSFTKLLIANRGEIALRIMRTCRAMGIAPIAIYSEADFESLHAVEADEAVCVGPAPSLQSYLNIESIISAALMTGADAIHPGYGFLSENAAFASACQAANIVFVGPSPRSIQQMGSKAEARRLAASLGVPVVPGYEGEDQSIEAFQAKALAVGFPILIKASAGGGGRGMRVVRSLKHLAESIESARSESNKAFGDGTLLIEKLVEGARHVEVQILGDHHGNLVHLFERDCSLQRRHQKIIEETPSPALTADLRSRMTEAALSVGRAIGYYGAGTVEFIVAPSGDFFFIEVNTRLQVEHPVTEMVTGLDLVRFQIEVAEGHPLPFSQEEVRATGHAIEARLYAERPANDFLPSAGAIVDWDVPDTLDGLRIDSGVQTGSEVSIYYDPLLAKVIAHGATRSVARRKLVAALKALSVLGVGTNQDFLVRLLNSPAFVDGACDTAFIDGHLSELVIAPGPNSLREVVAAVAVYREEMLLRAPSSAPPKALHYRNNPYRPLPAKFEICDTVFEINLRPGPSGGYELSGKDWQVQARVVSYSPGQLRLEIDGIQRRFRIIESSKGFLVHSLDGSFQIRKISRFPERSSQSETESASSPMPGQVL